MASYEPLSDRFFRGFIPEPNSGCWLWEGAGTGRWDYGSIRASRARKMLLAHRVSWELHCGEIPKDQEVCHRCDVPRCVNPNHLFLGTRQDNTDDCVAKGRMATGERVGASKLTWELVTLIREQCANGMTRRAAAKLHNIGASTVTYAVNGHTWKGAT